MGSAEIRRKSLLDEIKIKAKKESQKVETVRHLNLLQHEKSTKNIAIKLEKAIENKQKHIEIVKSKAHIIQPKQSRTENRVKVTEQNIEKKSKMVEENKL